MESEKNQKKIGAAPVIIGFFLMISTCSLAQTSAGKFSAVGLDDKDLIKVGVYRLFVDPASQQPVVTLADPEEKRAFPIWIGFSEARAIQSELEGVQHFRPLTHDLLAKILNKINVKIHRVVITHARDNVFYATLVIEQEDALIEIDARPSDSIVMALKFKAPIYVARSLFEKMSLSMQEDQEPLETEEEYGLVLQELTAEMAKYLSFESDRGVMIAGISKGSRAAKDGLKIGDIFVEVGDRRIDNLKAIHNALAKSKTLVKAKIFRDQQFLTLTLHLK
jgi:bifunctional DNase/RNase